MHRFFAVSAAALLGLMPVSAQSDTVSRFSKLEQTWTAAISPDGSHLAQGCSARGVRSICIYRLGTQETPALLLPPEDGRIEGLFWASADFLIYRVKVADSMKFVDGRRDVALTRLAAYNLATGESEILMQGTISMLDLTRVASLKLASPGMILMDVAYLMSEDPEMGSLIPRGGEAKYEVYEVDLKTGRGRLADRGFGSAVDRIYNGDGEARAELRRNYRTGSVEIVSRLDGEKTIFELSDVDLIPFDVEALGPEGKTLILDFDDGERDGLYTISLETGAIEPFTHEGQRVGDPDVIKDQFTEELIGFAYDSDLPERVYTQEPFASVASMAKASLGADSIRLLSWTEDQSFFTFAAIKRGQPAAYYGFDRSGPSISAIGNEAPQLDGMTLGEVISVRYAARDGLEIPGYITLPPGKAQTDGPFPLVVMPHGGPESRDLATYNWAVQALAAEGYAVLQPNFRGSSGFGADFRNAGYGEFGARMVEDVIDGAGWAVEQGYASPGGYCAAGFSYGGYSGLMSAVLAPGETGCVVAVAAPTDPVAIVQNDNRYAEESAYWERYIGSRRDDDAQDRISPLARSGEISAPVLLIHGTEDRNVEYRQSLNLANELGEGRARLITLEGEDHYLGQESSRMTVLREMLDFINTHHPAR